jgi:restriction endonuclease Mrr
MNRITKITNYAMIATLVYSIGSLTQKKKYANRIGTAYTNVMDTSVVVDIERPYECLDSLSEQERYRVVKNMTMLTEDEIKSTPVKYNPFSRRSNWIMNTIYGHK